MAIGIVRIFAERDALYSKRDALPLRDLAQLQRQMLLLKNAVAADEDELEPSSIELNIELVQSRINLLRLAPLENLLPPALYAQIEKADGEWGEIQADLEAWLQDPVDNSTQLSLTDRIDELELSLNDTLADINIFGLELNTQASASNSLLLLFTALVSLPIILTVILIAFILARATQNRMQSVIETESIRKYPEQSPFPIMRFNAKYELMYANPASKPLEPVFGIIDGVATKLKYLQWLDQAFQQGSAPQIEDESRGRIYSIICSLVEGEKVANIYGFDVTDLKQAERSVRRQLARLNALHTIDKAIATKPDLRTTFDILLLQTREHLGVDAAAIFVTHPNDPRLYSAAFQGFNTKEIANFSLMPGESLAGRVAAQRQILSIPDLVKSDIPVAPELNQIEGFKSYFASPLEVRGELLGVLETFQRRPFTPDAEWLEFLKTLAGQAAIALDNIHLFDGLKVSNTELRQAYDTTLEGWAKALELRDKETEGHSRRVTDLTMLLATRMGIAKEQWDDVRRGAILHDIGKMGVPDEILLKPGALSDAEWAIMKRHTQYAYDLLSPIPFLQPALEIPYAHHEKWDGSGYPRGLKGEEIPLAARIFAIADVWDALRSDRPYRTAWSKEKTLSYIQEKANTHFDPKVVESFLRLVLEDQIL